MINIKKILYLDIIKIREWLILIQSLCIKKRTNLGVKVLSSPKTEKKISNSSGHDISYKSLPLKKLFL